MNTTVVRTARPATTRTTGTRPVTRGRSVSEALMHVASEWYFFAPMSLAGAPPADFGPPRETLPRLEKIAGRAEVLARLDEAWAHRRAQVAAADPARLTGTYKPWNTTIADAVPAMSGDLHEHLGQLIAYSRAVGVKPPWSKRAARLPNGCRVTAARRARAARRGR